MAGPNPTGTVLVLGHSFISRLEQYVRKDERCWNVGLRSDMINMTGFPGGTTSNLINRLQRGDIMAGKRTVCLQIGGNCLSRPENTPDVVVRNIANLVGILETEYGVQCVVVSELFRRLKTRQHKKDVCVDIYNTRITQTNSLLRDVISQLPGCGFWTHGAHIWNEFELYGADGVHFKDMKPYFKYMKGCVLLALRMLNGDA
ncbi:hypothetical protein KP79_PYT14829 [Mizuhopecten yessoensis]|uniref:SGNH hydrolase-type esterase domain-containing protein n=1 Tax=Mizuhopecten yessoensis TaxID=6573 RepID=A0A210Q329_MIZYE|nr:hypothetical protein KP79_PYT14829 [Mizuhopecten yessoensis]